MKDFEKITFDTISEADNILDHLPENVRWQIIGNTADYEYCLTESLVDCESPIEQLLAVEIEIHLQTMFIPILIEDIFIDKQAEIIANWKTYRADFLITVKYWNGLKMYVVECDGHEFHQKTKEQVERDNERTRNLQASGYIVIRFSGTEIYHRSTRCARELKRIIHAPAIEQIKKVLKNEQN